MRKMRDFWRKNWCWLCGGVLILALYYTVGHLTERVRTESTRVSTLSLEEVRLLKAYHGARVVRESEGRWYFLGPRGRRWYPLTTPAACRDLKLACTETAAK